MLNGAGLAYPEAATTIRLDDDRSVHSDGPFVPAREQLTACYVVESENTARARSIAERVMDFPAAPWKCEKVHDSFGKRSAITVRSRPRISCAVARGWSRR